MTTVRDIALKADCSAATVSLVFQGDSRISKATARRVRATAKELDYKYAPKAKSAKADSNQRKFLLVTSALTGNPSPVYVSVIDGIADACREFTVKLSLHQLKNTDFSEVLSAKGYDAVIYGMADPATEKAMIENIKIPIVKVMSVPNARWPYDHVTYNNSMVGRIAGNYFVERGYRRVAIVSPDSAINNERVSGVREMVRENGGQVDFLLWPDNVSRQEIDELSTAFFKGLRDDKVTAIFSPGDSFTVSIYQMLLRQGIRPGQDIDVLSCNNENVLEQLHPRPPSIDIHARNIGRLAVQQLLWRLKNLKEPAVTVQMSPSLVETNMNGQGTIHFSTKDTKNKGGDKNEKNTASAYA